MENKYNKEKRREEEKKRIRKRKRKKREDGAWIDTQKPRFPSNFV